MKNVFIIFLLIAITILVTYGSYKANINKALGLEDEIVELTIEKGEASKSIISKLEEKGLIDSAFYLEIYLWESKKSDKLQAGDYVFNKGMTPVEIVEFLVRGEVNMRERNIKLLEGWKLSDMEEYFVKNDVFAAGEFSDLVTQSIDKWPFDFEKPEYLDAVPAGVDFEGYIFPDTYRIFRDANPQDVVKKTFDNLNRKLSSELLMEIEKQGKTVHEIMTMASIIEKEVRGDKDKAIVSGVLNKRLAIGMRLEVDSSINYISGKSDPAVSAQDLELVSPYNTYRNDGLPPGPICSPGLESIKAAIYPEESPYLFYLNRQDTGETIFSKNFDEHVRNKFKYLK